MTHIRPFEAQVIRTLIGDALPAPLLEQVLNPGQSVALDMTDSGYYLTVRHPALPAARATRSEPVLLACYESFQAGFLLHLGDHELTLECHTWCAAPIPSDFRARPVAIHLQAPITVNTLYGQEGVEQPLDR